MLDILAKTGVVLLVIMGIVLFLLGHFDLNKQKMEFLYGKKYAEISRMKFKTEEVDEIISLMVELFKKQIELSEFKYTKDNINITNEQIAQLFCDVVLLNENKFTGKYKEKNRILKESIMNRHDFYYLVLQTEKKIKESLPIDAAE